MILSHPSDTTVTMGCYCIACLEDMSTPPTDWISPTDWAYEQAAEACWQDMADGARDFIDRWDYL